MVVEWSFHHFLLGRSGERGSGAQQGEGEGDVRFHWRDGFAISITSVSDPLRMRQPPQMTLNGKVSAAYRTLVL
jgi:hypothetical protein